MPNIPTVAEAGVPGYEAVIWLGLMAPKGTPPAIVSRLNAEITKIAAVPKSRPIGRSRARRDDDDARQFRRYLADDIDKWERIVKLSGARADR